MTNLRITYDTNEGVASSDGKAESIVDHLLGQEGLVEYSTANGSIVDAVRVAVAQKRIESENVVFIFEGETIAVSPTGELDKWPRGFCDHQLNRLRTMMDLRRKKA